MATAEGSGGPSDRDSDIVLPDYLAREYDIAEELGAGGEADVALISRRRDGLLKVVKIYRRGITLPQSFVQQLATADPAHVLPVTRSTYTGWRTPRFIEVMDYLPEGSLETLLQRADGVMTGLARDILIEMTDALDYIHTQLHIVHRDIKPANILIRRRKPLDLVLADLGIAAELADLLQSRRETTGGLKGTLIYQSPETLNMSDAGAPRDWWALGMTLCEVLTGAHPFKDGRGHPLRDENRIRHAITMGAIDLSMIRDERWNLLCRGLLTHDADSRWAAPQIRAWLAGDSPPVASLKPQQGAQNRSVRPYRFVDGRRFNDPVELASHMVTNWDAAARVFTSEEECAALRTWIREDVADAEIDINSLTPLTHADQSRSDARIIEFTTHYRKDQNLIFRGVQITAGTLAEQYLKAAGRWEDDPLLSALTPNVVAALAESRRDDNKGPTAQSSEYYALASLSRFAEQLDQQIERARAQISTAASQWVDGVDVGSVVRDGLPATTILARGMGRAALLSPACATGIREEFAKTNASSPPWFADLCATARSHPSNNTGSPTNVDPDEMALKSLAVTTADLAATYRQAAAAAVEEGERKRAAERAEQERRRADQQAEEARQAIRRAAEERSAGDTLAILATAALAITVLVPFLIGQFLMTKTFVLKASPGVYEPKVRGIMDHFWATYLGGLVPLVLLLGLFLVVRRPWQGRNVAVGIGCIALIGSLVVLLPMAESKWNAAEQKTIAKLRETAFPFSASYYTCASWKIHAENGAHDPELWQVYLAQVKGTSGTGCNQVHVYRGWQRVGYYDLPQGDMFTGEIIVNHTNWKEPFRERESSEIWSQVSATGAHQAMNPLGTNVDLPTTNGKVVDFTLDVAGTDGFKLK